MKKFLFIAVILALAFSVRPCINVAYCNDISSETAYKAHEAKTLHISSADVVPEKETALPEG